MAETALIPYEMGGLSQKTQNKLIKLYEKQKLREDILVTTTKITGQVVDLGKTMMADPWGRLLVIEGVVFTLAAVNSKNAPLWYALGGMAVGAQTVNTANKWLTDLIDALVPF